MAAQLWEHVAYWVMAVVPIIILVTTVTSLSEAYAIFMHPIFLSWMLSAGAMYAFVGFGCIALDRGRVLRSQKCQPYKPYCTNQEYLEVLGVAAINFFVVVWQLALPLFKLWQYNNARGGWPALSADHTVFDWGAAAAHMVIQGLVIDVWFYWTHRLMHQGSLYKWIHKKHHRFTAPTSLAAVYAHPIEFLVGNFAGVALGPALTGCHPSVGVVWYCLTMFGTTLTHSGYGVTSAVHHHDMHHEFFNCNFGVSDLCDTMFSTTDRALGFAKKKEEKMAKEGCATVH